MTTVESHRRITREHFLKMRRYYVRFIDKFLQRNNQCSLKNRIDIQIRAMQALYSKIKSNYF